MTRADKTGSAGPITGVVAMLKIEDVERSVEFYRLLGFEIGNRVPPAGPPEWVWLYAPNARDWRRGPNLMLTRAEDKIDRSAQGALFYLYAADLRALREALLAHGVEAGAITYPEYLPEGEFALVDPDGYCLMIAQSSGETP
jgi:catechol 2,3-dioxygenase-like lactoylglutathione lyase family enzyme